MKPGKIALQHIKNEGKRKDEILPLMAVMTIRSVKILLVCNTDFFGKLVSIWSVFWVKVSIFEKVPTHFSKCVFLDYRICDKCDFVYAKMAKNYTFFPQKWPKLFSQKTPHTVKFFSILVSIFWYFGKKWSVFGQYFGKKWSV